MGYRILAVQHDGPAFRGKLVATVDIIVAVRGHRLRVLDSTLIEAIKVNKIRHNTTIYIIFFYSRRTHRRFSYPSSYSYRRIFYPHLYLLSHFFPFASTSSQINFEGLWGRATSSHCVQLRYPRGEGGWAPSDEEVEGRGWVLNGFTVLFHILYFRFYDWCLTR